MKPLFAPIVSLLLLISAAWTSTAQNQPRIAYVCPAGARQGVTVELTVGGQFLDGPTNAFLSGVQAEAAVLAFSKPLTQRQLNDLREKMKELQARRIQSRSSTNNVKGLTLAEQRLQTEIRDKLASAPKRNANPALAEAVRLRLSIPSNAPPGKHEIRLRTALGLSNPLVFEVGQFPEFSEQDPLGSSPDSGARVTLPAIANGQILPGDVDRFRFTARRGQNLVLETSARALIPYLPDAVPGWFQAAVALYDSKGKEVAYADDYRYNPDPVLFFKVPQDGDYILEIKDAIYRGRQDFVYRITMAEKPFVTSVFPPSVPASTSARVELKGHNLSTPGLVVDTSKKLAGIHHLATTKQELLSNPFPVLVDDLPLLTEQENGTTRELTLPVAVQGRIDSPGDTDIFRFAGQAGEVLVAEVHARRLNSPLDSVLKILDGSGRVLALNDDTDDKGAGLFTHHADSRITLTLSNPSPVEVQISDAQRKGGPDYVYRLRVSAPQPGFELRLVPSTINARAGTTVPLTVYALRKDGFSNEIALALSDAKPGFSLSGARIPRGQDQVRLTLTVPASPARAPLTLRLHGSAEIDGKSVTRNAVPADDMMQAFSYRHLVPAQEFKLCLLPSRAVARPQVQIAQNTPIQLSAREPTRLRFSTRARAFLNQTLNLELQDPPEGITLRKVSPKDNGSEVLVQCDATKVKPGLAGNLVFAAYGRQQDSVKGKAAQRRAPLGVLPAVPFEVVP